MKLDRIIAIASTIILSSILVLREIPLTLNLACASQCIVVQLQKLPSGFQVLVRKVIRKYWEKTLMRWLLYFLPNRYALSVPNYSEVFYRIKTS